METVSGSKEVVPRSSVVDVIATKLKEMGPLGLVVAGRSDASSQ